jgi:bacteriophage N4 adsorption protein B
MMSQAIAIFGAIQDELLLFGAFWFLVGAIDDLCIDVAWVGIQLSRRFRTPRIKSLSHGHNNGQDSPMAVFVPVWAESAVIGTMLQNCGVSWKDSPRPYYIYVGYYPNDPASLDGIVDVAKNATDIRPVLIDHDGPTTKADSLNSLWAAMVEDESAGGYKCKAVILHDAEDAVHPDELAIFDQLIGEYAAVQLPVIPIRTQGSLWVSGHYCDEFAESHGKTMIVREALGAALPLAGVGCAIDRIMLGRIAAQNGGKPFDESSLTEDYELGLRIGSQGGRTKMARLIGRDGRLVGTRSCFPETLSASVRQKSRWLTGIAFAGWDRLGWHGGLAQKWMLLHDRRSIFAALVIFLAYAGIASFLIGKLFATENYFLPRPMPPILSNILLVNSLFLFWRLGARAAFVGSIYGPAEALLSIPRVVVANLIAILSARRAFATYLRHCFGAPLRWDKTDHIIVPVIPSGAR